MKRSIKSGRVYRNVALIFATLVMAVSPLLPLYEAGAAYTTNVTDKDGNVWDMSLTRSTGFYEATSGGLRTYTTGTTSTDKVAGYLGTSGCSLNDVVSTSVTNAIKFTTTTGSTGPSAQLAVDFDDDNVADGYLVGELAYGGDWWLSNDYRGVVTPMPALNTPHDGRWAGKGAGTLAEWFSLYGDINILEVGFSFGSGVYGDFTISEVNLCGQYIFDTTAPVLRIRQTADPSRPDYANNSIVNLSKGLAFSKDDTSATLYYTKNGSAPISLGYSGGSSGVLSQAALQGDGVYTYFAVDAYGNESNIIMLTVDKTAPVLAEPGVWVNGVETNNGDVVGTANSDQVHFKACMDDANPYTLRAKAQTWGTGILIGTTNGGDFSEECVEWEVASSAFAEGENYELYIEMVDKAGNGKNVGFRFTVDATAPTFTVTKHGTATIIESGSIIDTVNDAYKVTTQYHRGVEDKTIVTKPNGSTHTIAAGSTSGNMNYVFNAGDGVYTFVSIDKAGNESAPYTLVLDTEFPVIEDVTVTKDMTNENSIVVNGTVYDANLKSYDIRVYDATKAALPWNAAYSVTKNTNVVDGELATLDISSLADGVYYVRIWATDLTGKSNGNTGTHPAIYIPFTVDRTAPVMTVNGEFIDGKLYSSQSRIGVIIDDTNFDYFTIDGNKYGSCNEADKGNHQTCNINFLADGEHTLIAYDKAGNTTALKIFTDKTSPVISNIHIESDNDNPNYAKAGDTISVSFDVTEPIRSLDAGIRLASAGGRVTFSGNTESPSTCADMGSYYTCTLTYVVQAGDSNGLVEFFLNGYRDAAGNPGVAMSQDDIEDDSYVIIDTEAPTGTITYDPSTWTNGDVIATLTTSEPVQDIAGWTKVDDTTFTKVYTRNTIESVRFADLAGNEGSTLARVQIIDRANPIVMLDLRDISKLFGWTNQDYDLRATAFDLPLFGGSGIASIEYTFDGVCDEDSTWITGSVATATENGKLCFRATDNAGNTSRVLEISINNIDKVAPALNPEYWTKTVEADKDATFTCPTANPTDNASGATYVMHNSNVNMGVPGSYKCQYKTTDGAGNVSWNDVFITVVDTTPPTFHPEYWTKTVEADRSGTPFTCPTAYGTDKAAGTVTVTMHNSNVNITTPGSYKCQYVTEDANGNKAWNDVFITVVDTTAPDVSISVAPTIIIGREANGYYNYATVRLNLVNSDDNNDFLTYSINGGAYQNYIRALTITADTEICAIAADIYGNESEPVCETILIDRDAPIVTDVTLDPEILTNGDVTITITAEDDKSGLAANACIFGNNMVEVALRALLGLGWGSCETTVAANGTVYYAVRDNLGNITYGSKTVENIDKTLPVVDSVSVNGQVIEKGDTVTINCTDTEIEITVEASDANMAWLEAKLQHNIGDIQVGEGSQKGVNTITFTISVADLLATDTDDFELWIQTGDLAGNHYNEAFGFNIFIDQTDCTEIPCDGCEGGSGNGGQEDNGEIVSSTTRNWTYAYDNGNQEVLGDTDEETGDINGEKNNQDVAGETDENKDESAADSWALLNLLMVVLTALIAVGAMIRRSDKENSALRTGTIVVAFVAIVAFVITQNMTLPMTFADNWSILMVALAVINIGLIAGLIKSSDKDDSKK